MLVDWIAHFVFPFLSVWPRRRRSRSIRTYIIKLCKLFLRAGFLVYIALPSMPAKARPWPLTPSNCRRLAWCLAYIITKPTAREPWSVTHAWLCDTLGPWSMARGPMLVSTNLKC